MIRYCAVCWSRNHLKVLATKEVCFSGVGKRGTVFDHSTLCTCDEHFKESENDKEGETWHWIKEVNQ